ncbi:MAG: sulfite exporter TauE/SafE family protein [Holophagaceae bacterium]|nr:sulfite exporter TauE/SafE family protein [Holophagaceae bacterium]
MSAVSLDPLQLAVLVVLTGLAGGVNGVLGHGFSTVTVPVALLLLANRLLNPVLVLLELALNLGAFLANLRHFPKVAPRVVPMVGGLVPGIALGAWILSITAPGPMKLLTYLLLFPIVVLQGLGLHRAFRSERAAALPFGLATGLLYATTTISGPILSLYFHNQAYAKDEYRAAISFLRVVEAALTALAYLGLGIITRDSFALAAPLLPGTLAGLAVGLYAARRIEEQGFRRFCVWFNVLAVSFGLARVLSPVLGADPVRIHILWVLPLATGLAVQTRGFGLFPRGAAALDPKAGPAYDPHL